jgi:hypothetical protein
MASFHDLSIIAMLKKTDTWERIEKWSIPEPNSGCFIWLGVLDTSGYAAMTGPLIDRKRVAIRVARLVLANKLQCMPVKALHTCDVRCCINENHLYDGTDKHNVHDMYNRGRRVIVRDQYGKIT